VVSRGITLFDRGMRSGQLQKQFPAQQKLLQNSERGAMGIKKNKQVLSTIQAGPII